MRLFVDQFSVQVFIEESRKLQESVFREEHNAILQVFVKLDREYIHNNRIKVPVYIIIPIIFHILSMITLSCICRYLELFAQTRLVLVIEPGD